MKFKNVLTNLVILAFIIISPVSLISSNNTTEIEQQSTTQAVKNWTYMLYLCGDTRDNYVTSNLDNSANWVYSNLLSTINSLSATDLLPGSEDDLNVIALLDRPYSQNYPHGNAEILIIQTSGIITKVNYGATNMGEAITLTNFINYCKTNYPANNYALTLSDHGGGYAGFCYDYHAPHPYWGEAFGDSLSVQEIEQSLSTAGGVDVLFIDCCLGGSFELLWQLEGEADYVVTGESTQPGYALYHPRDILYNLSRDTSMVPLSLAFEGFRSGVNPVYCPTNDKSPSVWDTIAVYDLTQFDASPPLGGSSLMDTFNEFTFYLNSEVTNNVTKARDIFGEIRQNLHYPPNIFESNSLMVDLRDFVSDVLDHSDDMFYKTQLENFGLDLLDLLEPSFPSTGGTIIEHFVRTPFDDDNVTGFSICFPDCIQTTSNYLNPYNYVSMDLCANSYWDEFIFNLYPTNAVFLKFPIYEYYEINLDQIDPCVELHIYFDNGPGILPSHIGYTLPENANAGMDLEIGIEGATYQSSMLFGNTKIQIPVTSIPSISKDVTKQFQIVVNATGAASTTKDVNLTITHIDPTGILWEDTKIADIQIGQVISTNVTTDDTWTDWVELAPPSTDRFSGFTKEITGFTLIFTFTLVMYFSKRKRSFK